MRHSKLRLLTGTAAGALSLAVAGQAMAFDEVHWEWNKVIDEYIDKDIVINEVFTPTGMLELQNLQVYIGNVTATSTVTSIDNNQPDAGTEGGDVTVTLEGRVSDQTVIDNAGVASDADPDGDGSIAVDSATNATVNSLTYENVTGDDVNSWTANLTVSVPGGDSTSYDALTELPEVESVATAVANNSNISSDVMVEMHESQWAWGGFNGGDNGEFNGGNGIGEEVAGIFDGFYNPEGSEDNPTNANNTNDYTGNLGVSGALTLIAAGAGGYIQSGEVTALSEVDDILNATVVSNATAVANNKNVDLQYNVEGDGVFIGDVTQFAYMNVSSTSNVSNVSLNNYSGLGNLDRPIVSSVATSVGNNLSVTVNGPSAD